MSAGFSWAAWHNDYADPTSELSHRLVHVQRRLRDALDAAPPGPIRVVSLCAGEGRDLLGVLPDHPRRDDVRARLVEVDPEITERARAVVGAAGLTQVEIVTGDAAIPAAYEGLIPADIVLACGIFGNVDDEDIRNTIRGLRQLSRPGATVLWTRHRNPPDATPTIRQWFREHDFDEVAFDSEENFSFGVGTQRFIGETAPLEPDARLFRFRTRTH